MDDGRIWSFEESLWVGDAAHYRELIDPQCLMSLPAKPYLFSGEEAVKAVSDTPRWARVTLSDRRVARPEEGLIVIAYKADAERDGQEPYSAHCTSVLRRIEHEVWRVVQHCQLPVYEVPAQAS